MNNQFGKNPIKLPNRMVVPVNKTPGLKPMNPEVLRFIMGQCADIRKVICVGCPSQRLYDKNGKLYNITRNHTLDDLKKIVEEIRKINEA